MCLLHGDDRQKQGEDRQQPTTAFVTHDKDDGSSKKNEALAIRYLTRLCGIDCDSIAQAQQLEQGEEIHKSVLPSDELSSSMEHVGVSETVDEAALIELASCHLTGTGVSQCNPLLAIHCLTTAYHQMKSVTPTHKLAQLYESSVQSNGLIPIDIVAAYEWYKTAALHGHVASMAELALCYKLGCGM